MNLLAKLKSITKSAPIAGSGFYAGDGISQGTSRDEMGHALVGLVHRCLRLRAQALTDTQFIVQLKQSQTDAVDAPLDNWLVRLLENPSNDYDAIELRRLTQMWLDINGNAFWLLSRSKTDVLSTGTIPDQIHIIPAPLVTVKMKNGVKVGYRLRIGMVDSDYELNEIVHFRQLAPSTNPKHFHLGQSLVKTALREIRIEDQSKAFIERYYENDAQPPLILETENEMSQEDFTNFKARWDQRIKNYKIQAVLSGGMKLGVPPAVSLDIKGIGEDVRIALCALFGTPWSYVSGDYAGGLNASTQSVKDGFNIDEMEPIRKYYAAVMTKAFSQYDVAICVKHVEYKYRDANEVRAQTLFELQNGLTTINEVLIAEGKDPIGAGGDVRMVSKTIQTIDQLIAGVQTTSLQLTQETPQLSKGQELELAVKRGVWWKKVDAKATTFSKQLVKVIASQYKALGAEVIRNLKKQKSYKTKDGLAVTLFDDEAFRKKFGVAVKDLLEGYSGKTSQDALKEAGGGDLPPSFADTLQDVVDETTSKIMSTSDTVADKIRGILDDNPFATVDELTSKIEDLFETYGIEGASARRIAQTSTTNITSGAQRATFDAMQVKSQWTSQRDGNVRATHAAADGSFPDENGLFHVGSAKMRYPASGDSSEEAVNCRCYLYPVKSKK